MKIPILFCLSFLVSIFSFQDVDSKYKLKLNYGELYPEELDDFSDVLTLKKSESDSEYIYRIVQFYDIPNQAEKLTLQKNGIDLLSYLPNYAFAARVHKNIDQSKIKQFDIRSILAMDRKIKVSKFLAENKYPDWAIENDNLRLKVQIFSDDDNLNVVGFFDSLNAKVFGYLKENRVFFIGLPIDNFDLLTENSFVQWIEPIEAASTPEDNISRNSCKSNTLNNTAIPGRNYTGEGVSVALSDSGIIGPHIDFEGRVTARTNENTGNHGDMTSGLFVGAGNLNPRYGGIAPGAEIEIYRQGNSIFINSYQHYIDANENYNSLGTVITSTSYSQGQGGIYTTDSQFADQQVYDNSAILHVLSAGNSGTFDHGYGAGPGWANISGGIKAGKNVICAGNLDENDQIFGTSSRGPAADGRIKPDLCARGQRIISTDKNNTYQNGAGTSASTPIIAGASALLYEAYRTLNGGEDPNSGLIKAAMLNTARDLGNPGPDYVYGWGKLNLHKAMTVIENEQYVMGDIENGETETVELEVPADVAQLKVMTYWTDEGGNPSSGIALVNNINMKLVTPDGSALDPWVLDATPDPNLLNAPATRAVDNINNMEQVTIDNPVEGTYEVLIGGVTIPSSIQEYYVIYEFIQEGLEVTHPIGNENWVPNEMETIHWDASQSDETFTVELSTDGGVTYSTLESNIDSDRRYLDIIVPEVLSNNCIVRILRGNVEVSSLEPFNIMSVPVNLEVVSVCPASITLDWDDLDGVENFEVYILGEKYMESIGTSTVSEFEITGLNPNEVHWFSVSPILDGEIGQRTVAIQQEAGTVNCSLNFDMQLKEIVSPIQGSVPDCIGLSDSQVRILLSNIGTESLSDLNAFYQVNNGDVVSQSISDEIMASEELMIEFSENIDLSITGTYQLSVWIENNMDQNNFNDTSNIEINVISSDTKELPHYQSFNNFTECRSQWTTCDLNCTLSEGYVNFENGVVDDIDWRVRNGQTPSFNFVNTGVSGDFDNNGNGNYLYLESIENCHLKEGSIMSPCVDLSNIECPILEFAYSMFGNAMGEIHVDLVTPQGIVKDVMPAIVGNQGIGWNIANVDLSEYNDGKVNLIITGITGEGSASVMAIDAINFYDNGPSANFDFQVDEQDMQVMLTNNSTGDIMDVEWDFGDGNTSSEMNPTHIYEEEGVYELSLIVNGECGSDTLIQNIMLGTSSINNSRILDSQIDVFPNPVVDLITIMLSEELATKKINAKIYDTYGRQVFESSYISENQHDIDLQSFTSGLYMIEVIVDSKVYVSKIIKE